MSLQETLLALPKLFRPSFFLDGDALRMALPSPAKEERPPLPRMNIDKENRRRKARKRQHVTEPKPDSRCRHGMYRH